VYKEKEEKYNVYREVDSIEDNKKVEKVSVRYSNILILSSILF
jgi:hypothetical protein